jgi:uncharacterized protein
MSKFIFAFLLFFTTWARADFKVPRLTGPVMDQVGILRSSDRQDLDQVLRDYNARGKAQIQVLIIDSLQDEPLEQASIKITDAWKLGAAKKDNGILFLIVPNERKMRIEVGQGLEGALPDIYTKRIIEDTVIPRFRAKDMSSGVLAGVYQIIAYVDKEYADQNLQQPEPEQKSIPGWVIILIIIFILFMGRFMPRSSYRGGGWGGGGFGGGGWGGGGGGWSGGGGGFSGGGASGSW